MVQEKNDNIRALFIYLLILVLLCAGFIFGARLLGEQGVYLAQGYMLTPAIAALITRLFFYKPRFKDANLRLGRLGDYFKIWLAALAITAVSYGIYTLLGAIGWDLSGSNFLVRLGEQFALSGEDINDTLPAGFTPHMMLWLFVIGGLTVFNILPGLITGFGEEFGHRGFMFPALYRINPWLGFILGGLLWFAWHVAIQLMLPPGTAMSARDTVLNYLILAAGSICTFAYLSAIYVKSRSVFVTAIAHIAMNNAAAALSYFVVVENQLLANLGLTLTMLLVVLILAARRMFSFSIE